MYRVEVAPLKEEGRSIRYDAADQCPHPHPRHRQGSLSITKVRAYFGWWLMHGMSVEDLQKDEYWKYMEGDRDAKEEEPRTSIPA